MMRAAPPFARHGTECEKARLSPYVVPLLMVRGDCEGTQPFAKNTRMNWGTPAVLLE